VLLEDFTPASRALEISLDQASLTLIQSDVSFFMCNCYNDADSYSVVVEAGKVSRRRLGTDQTYPAQGLLQCRGTQDHGQTICHARPYANPHFLLRSCHHGLNALPLPSDASTPRLQGLQEVPSGPSTASASASSSSLGSGKGPMEGFITVHDDDEGGDDVTTQVR
jgi:hypothetical protein